jgi:16S rRNA processing protein RimM
VARVVKPQGRRGEVAVELLTDFPERFEERRKLTALLVNGDRRELQLVEFWEHQGRLVMKFDAIDSIDTAQALVGAELQIKQSERAELEAGSAYVSDLVGCHVFEQRSGAIGEIADVIFGAGTAPLLVINQERDGRARELMIPFAEEYVRHMDTAAKRLELSLPEGMLELDAPLSKEEKEDQQREH